MNRKITTCLILAVFLCACSQSKPEPLKPNQAMLTVHVGAPAQEFENLKIELQYVGTDGAKFVAKTPTGDFGLQEFALKVGGGVGLNGYKIKVHEINPSEGWVTFFVEKEAGK